MHGHRCDNVMLMMGFGLSLLQKEGIEPLEFQPNSNYTDANKKHRFLGMLLYWRKLLQNNPTAIFYSIDSNTSKKMSMKLIFENESIFFFNQFDL